MICAHMNINDIFSLSDNSPPLAPHLGWFAETQGNEMTEKKTDLQEEIRRVEWDITELCGSIERIAWYVKDGRTLSGDKKDSEELLSSLNKAFEKLWQLDAVARQLDELQKKGPLLASEVAAIKP